MIKLIKRLLGIKPTEEPTPVTVKEPVVPVDENKTKPSKLPKIAAPALPIKKAPAKKKTKKTV